jgi:hypothetical protein
LLNDITILVYLKKLARKNFIWGLYMKDFEVCTLLLLLFLCVYPDLLKVFTNMPGKILLLSIVIYLVQTSPVLGVAAALMLTRVFQTEEPTPYVELEGNDRHHLEVLLRSGNSFFMPSLRSREVPPADYIDEYTSF